MRTIEDGFPKKSSLWIGESHSDQFDGRLIIVHKEEGVVHICRASNGQKTASRVLNINLNEGTVFVGKTVYCKHCKDLHTEGTFYTKDHEENINNLCPNIKGKKGI